MIKVDNENNKTKEIYIKLIGKKISSFFSFNSINLIIPYILTNKQWRNKLIKNLKKFLIFLFPIQLPTKGQ